MKLRTAFLVAAATLAIGGLARAGDDSLDPKAALGKQIFFDKTLSEPAGQSCSSCHQLAHSFVDPRPTPTSHGANASLFGPRNTPSVKYASFTPKFQPNGKEGGYLGGQFRDGRVNTLEEQAKLPFVNPIEMGNPDSQAVVTKVSLAPYAAQFQAVFGADIFSHPIAAYEAIASSLAAFERTKVFAPFDSKYDAFQQGRATLTDAEARGLAAFNDPARGNCAKCHLTVSPTHPGGTRPLLTDFGYDNAGVPRNPENKFYRDPAQYNPSGRGYIDLGLEGVLLDPATRGQFKAPSLRNVAVTGPYMHNGYFKTLRGVVDFYSTRDAKPACPSKFTTEADALAQGCWPAPEMAETKNVTDMGNLHLSEQEIDDIVAFLGTLTDGWTPEAAPR
jgi:cytochrome c peroxidase